MLSEYFIIKPRESAQFDYFYVSALLNKLNQIPTAVYSPSKGHKSTYIICPDIIIAEKLKKKMSSFF